ncbi:YiiD C-terminal domain-containing protein [Aeoliella mucimassa]|uniref:Thioesterase (YiiD_Cterm) n=1 Tax=Aeoliella mucimassa TaxID=2527972 RepID=A0A518ATT6_9BACT|nr:YiiD C-terminal domain-containing protein [Aeoliella mucimassa]QDU58127.1 Putative thioesterase (yiiD_Cterm) [Aeoliella mucimassa]
MQGTTHPPYEVPADHLSDLQKVLDNEIPMCAQMNMLVAGHTSEGLAMSMPLELNRNHHLTAFAGSLNALCTIAGWGTVYLLLRRLGEEGNTVIRRSSIKYHLPVSDSLVIARCHPVAPAAEQHFAEMYLEKGQAKLDLSIEIAGDPRPSVVFSGSYVVTRQPGCRFGMP